MTPEGKVAHAHRRQPGGGCALRAGRPKTAAPDHAKGKVGVPIPEHLDWAGNCWWKVALPTVAYVFHRSFGEPDMSKNAKRPSSDAQTRAKKPAQPDASDRGELEPAAGTPDDPVPVGEMQAGDTSELAQALGGPVDVSVPGRSPSSRGRADNVSSVASSSAVGDDTGAPADPEDEVDLVVSLDTIAGIIDAARGVGELQEESANEETQDPESEDDVDPDGLEGSLKGLIDELNEDEQAALIALTWIGRGDYDTSEWKEVLRLAKERNVDGTAAGYLIGMELFGDYLSEGVAAFGFPAEEIAR
jgi:hypothetical protein